MNPSHFQSRSVCKFISGVIVENGKRTDCLVMRARNDMPAVLYERNYSTMGLDLLIGSASSTKE